MEGINLNLKEISLDPDDWNKYREFAHKAVDLVFDHQMKIAEKKVWQEIPENSKNTFLEQLPKNEMPLEDIYSTFKDDILPYTLGNIHPSFFGWVVGQ